MPTPRDLEFLFEIGTLRNVPRGWRQHLAVNCASNLEHSFRVAWIALILSRREKAGNIHKILAMALTHDLAETRTSDHSYVQKVYVEAHEEQAARDLFLQTSIEDFMDVLAEYERRETIEAKIVKDADNLDIDLELKELEEIGHPLPKKWQGFRRKVRDEKLYTGAAQALWDDIQTADPSSWHLGANKWLIIPHAGL